MIDNAFGYSEFRLLVESKSDRFAEFGPLMRKVLRVASLVLAVGLTGCAGILSGAGPSKGAITDGAGDVEFPYTLIDLSAKTIGPFLREQALPPKPSVSSVVAPSIRLVAGDVLNIMVSDNVIEGGVFAPLATGGTTFSRVTVDSAGMISLPYVGKRKVTGSTLFQVEDAIRAALRGIATDPQVHVQLVSDLSGSVLVAGAVKTPGRFSTLQGPLTLLDAVNMAGGPLLEPHLVNVIVRTGVVVETIPYQELLAGNNRPVPPHSEIVIERARKRYVAMGAVESPGLHDLTSDNPSLLETIAAVGGLKEQTADATGVFIFRLSEQSDGKASEAIVFRLNMADPSAIFLARKFIIKPEDAIYVTNAAVYEWQKIISPIVQVLMLGRTINNGF